MSSSESDSSRGTSVLFSISFCHDWGSVGRVPRGFSQRSARGPAGRGATWRARRSSTITTRRRPRETPETTNPRHSRPGPGRVQQILAGDGERKSRWDISLFSQHPSKPPVQTSLPFFLASSNAGPSKEHEPGAVGSTPSPGE